MTVKKNGSFFLFANFFFSNKKKLYWGPRMTPHKELKASIPQEAQYSSTKKKIVKVSALGAASKQGSTRAAELLAYG